MIEIYEKRVVLFLDILGFRELISSGRQKDLLDALTIPQSLINKPPFDGSTTLQMTTFSDSIFISEFYHPEYPNSVSRIIHYAKYLWWRLAAAGVLSRGGIAIGECYNKDNIAFGPALIDAYEAEQKHAIYPRILISQEVNDIFHGFFRDPFNILRGLVKTDFDGLHHVHVMYPISLPEEIFPYKGTAEGYMPADLQRVMKTTIDRILATRPQNPRAYEKHVWLEKYLNSSLGAFHG